MLRSVDDLRLAVAGPLEDRCGPQARMLTVELHGKEVRGLAICPGRVVKYVLMRASDGSEPLTCFGSQKRTGNRLHELMDRSLFSSVRSEPW